MNKVPNRDAGAVRRTDSRNEPSDTFEQETVIHIVAVSKNAAQGAVLFHLVYHVWQPEPLLQSLN